MRYYDDKAAFQARGIDFDLDACLDTNPQGAFTILDIDRVLAVYEGENNERDWRWILRLHDGRYVYLRGGCDYTGWDCQSWASHTFEDSPEAAVDVEANDTDGDAEVVAMLRQQLADGKQKTWHESTGEALAALDQPPETGG